MRFVRLTTVGALVGILAGCSTAGDQPAPPAEAASSVDNSSGDTSETSGDGAGSAESSDNLVPRVIESDVQADSLEALIRLAEDAGLDCSDTGGEGEAGTHEARLCAGNVLFTYFTDVDVMDSYATGYVEKGNHVVLGNNWFVTGRPAAVEPLISTLQGG